MFVEALVSSIKTSRFGSSLVWLLRQALRAAATSGRSCSAACRLFFKGEIQMTKEPEDGGLADSHLLLRQLSLKFGQRDVWPCGNPLRNPIPVRLQNISFIPTKLLRTDASGATPTRDESTHRADAHAVEISNLFVTVARLDRLNYTLSQIFRIWLPHPCWPPVQWEA